METRLFARYWMAAVLVMTFLQGMAAQNLLAPEAHPKFEVRLPNPAKIDATQGGTFEMRMAETVQWLGLRGPGGDTLHTTVWGYGLSGGGVGYPGPSFEARHGVPVDVRWVNDLPTHHLLPVDPTIHLAHTVLGGVPAVTHLHGGHNEAASDGLPEAWFTPEFLEKGPDFVKETYHYDNDNEAATLWYHDHALGITRLNVYAGLAGFYLLRDANEEALRTAGILPDKAFEQEIVFQDRMFTAGGQLHFPAEAGEVGQPEPGVLPEFFGDFILVNGVAWPYMEVQPRKYRFRLLNGSDSRFFIVRFGDQMEFWQIASDNGLLEQPVLLNELLLGPGERAEVILDFTGLPNGTEVLCTNRGPDEPFRGLNPDGSLDDGEGGQLDPAEPETTGRLMKFVVSLPLSNLPDATLTPATVLRPPIEPFDTAGLKVRQLVLFEGEDQYGRLRPQLGIYAPGSPLNGSLLWEEETTEVIDLDAVEVWEIFNATEDAHPIHLHLVAYQILNRQDFEGEAEEVGTDPVVGGTKQVLELEGLSGQPEAPAANEKGWKDTGIMLPGQVTRIAARFDRAGTYVWHCHILSHEDHEMMRRLVVVEPLTAPGPADPAGWSLGPVRPNPFTEATRIDFELPDPETVRIDVLNASGQGVRSLVRGMFPAGRHRVRWDGADDHRQLLPAGVYYCRMTAGNRVQTIRLMVLR